MANLQETPTWETGIYQFEITDPVLGGPDGIDNVPTKQLANRTLYLKNQQDSISSSVLLLGNRVTSAENTNASQTTRITNLETETAGMRAGTVNFTTQPVGTNNLRPATTEFVNQNRGGLSGVLNLFVDTTINVSAAGKLILYSQPANATFSVPSNSIFKDGDMLTFTKTETGVLKIDFVNSYVINGSFKETAYLHSGETIQFLKITGFWVVLNSSIDFSNVGEVSFGHVIRNGYLEMNGALLSRSAYPRLWEYAQTTNVVSDATWSFNNKGCFSSGDESTTFRLPDFRNTFTRSKSMSRSIGNYQADEIKSHTHLGVPGNQSGPYNQMGTSPGSLYKLDGTGYTSATGGEETRPQNITLYQMIKY